LLPPKGGNSNKKAGHREERYPKWLPVLLNARQFGDS